MNQEIKDFIYSEREEIVNSLEQLVEIPSVRGNAEEHAPFGAEPRKALEKMSELCKKLGLEPEIHDDVMLSADFCPENTEAELGILCHLDVVPAEPLNWNYSPYKLTREGGKLIGRGAIDDKGPAVAALYAVYCLKQLGVPLKKGVRLLFGTDEENGSSDLEIYRKNNKLPPMVFTPDGSFPVINIEKGMIRAFIGGEYEEGSVLSFKGGSVPNAIPDKAEALVEGVTRDELKAVIAVNNTGALITFDNLENGQFCLHCTGRSAHASTPEQGVNAVTALIQTLLKLPLKEGRQKDIFKKLAETFPFGETDGSSCGLKISDEKSGALTLAFSKFSMENGKIGGCIDIRFPVCARLSEVTAKLSAALKSCGLEYVKNIEEEPHYVPEDSFLVKKLLSVYERVEGVPGKCIAIGGGTYVHTVDGGVAFGAERGDTDYHMHGNDEFITEEELLQDAFLFACAVAEICG